MADVLKGDAVKLNEDAPVKAAGELGHVVGFVNSQTGHPAESQETSAHQALVEVDTGEHSGTTVQVPATHLTVVTPETAGEKNKTIEKIEGAVESVEHAMVSVSTKILEDLKAGLALAHARIDALRTDFTDYGCATTDRLFDAHERIDGLTARAVEVEKQVAGTANAAVTGPTAAAAAQKSFLERESKGL